MLPHNQSQQQQETSPMNAQNIRSLNDMLYWGIQNSDPEALRQMAQGTRQPNFDIAESQAKIKWLNESLKEMGLSTDLGKRMKEIIDTLNNVEPISYEQMIPLLEELGEIVEDIDLALDFEKMQGLDLISRILFEDFKSIETINWTVNDLETMEAMANVLGICSQNNLHFQNRVLQHRGDFIVSLIQTLNRLAEAQKASENVITEDLRETCVARQGLMKKLLFALSSLLSANQKAVDGIAQIPDAIRSLIYLLHVGTKDIRYKILTLLDNIIITENENSRPVLTEQLIANGFLDVLMSVLRDAIQNNQLELVEKGLDTIADLKQSKKKGIRDKVQHENMLQQAGIDILKERIKNEKGDDREYLNIIREKLNDIK